MLEAFLTFRERFEAESWFDSGLKKLENFGNNKDKAPMDVNLTRKLLRVCIKNLIIIY
tara:strand:+ start:409 stop:582 length:174 start_codon:yes stop_codon:yes gene_type:complete